MKTSLASCNADNGYDQHTETYGYDPQLDTLTSASYGDGLPNASPSWSYDAAGNRNDSVVDNLNRATSLGGVAVTSDVLGNRLTKGGATYTWDCLNRMASYVQPRQKGPETNGIGTVRGATTYAYRADGIRVEKDGDAGTTRYRHDGQMGIEDEETDPRGAATVTRYGLGARGVDLIERTNAQGTVTAFPLYDAHGNNVASLTRSGSGFQIGDRRTYDAWGVVRAQQSGGDPKLRYCASLGHKADDESGLVYMRARYYEPTSGRFISEDSARDGRNFFSYAKNDPVNQSDSSGHASSWAGAFGAFVIGVLTTAYLSNPLLGGLVGLALYGGDAALGKYFGTDIATVGGTAALALMRSAAMLVYETIKSYETMLTSLPVMAADETLGGRAEDAESLHLGQIVAVLLDNALDDIGMFV